MWHRYISLLSGILPLCVEVDLTSQCDSDDDDHGARCGEEDAN